MGYSVIFVVASCTLVLYQPAAAGSGIPEIIITKLEEGLVSFVDYYKGLKMGLCNDEIE